MSTAVAATCWDVFFDDLCRATDRVLLLDYDGIVAPFSADRTRAFPYPTIPELLDSIHTTCRTRVALISARNAHEIPPLLGLYPHPEIWGAHGLERLFPDGQYHFSYVSQKVLHALAEADTWLEAAGLHDCTELRPGSIAVLWKGLSPSQIKDVRTRALGALAPLAKRAGLQLAEFEGGLEMRVANGHRGNAIRTILSEVNSEAAVAYLGDDNGDQSAFEALKGHGLTVLVAPAYHATCAQVWLQPPGEVVQFLTDWVRACGGEI